MDHKWNRRFDDQPDDGMSCQPGRRIYADHAATAPLCAEALSAMQEALPLLYGNPSSAYEEGRMAKNRMEEARRTIASVLHAHPDEIYFTSGGSEADNWALKGAVQVCGKCHSEKDGTHDTDAAKAGASEVGTVLKQSRSLFCADAGIRSAAGCHIVSSAIEHHAVLHTLEALEKQGVSVTYVRPDENGVIHANAIEEALRPETVLVTLMTANNETGVLQPVEEVGALCRARGILFHTDAVQAAGHIPLSVEALSCDLLSLSAHKFGGPKGIGALYIRRGVRIARLIEGGGQERGQRAGTENVPGICAMAVALSASAARMEREAAAVRVLRDRLTERVLAEVPDVRLFGSMQERLPGHADFGFQGVSGEMLVAMLDSAGIAASAGAACSSGAAEESHVLRAMNVPSSFARGALRISLGADNTAEEIDRLAEEIRKAAETLRSFACG